MIVAAIDIGTNTVLMLIGEQDKEGEIKILRDETRLVRLGEGVDQEGNFNLNAMSRMRDCFRDYRKILNEYEGIKVLATATSGSRDASNASSFFENLGKEFFIPITIISGKEEAELSFKGALLWKDKKTDYLVIDIGGGSTEFIGIKEQELFYRSFNMGCVRIHERFFHHDPPINTEIAEAKAFIRNIISSEKSFFLAFQEKQILALAGTATYMASSILDLREFEKEKIHGYKIHFQYLLSMKERFLKLSSKERLGIGAMDKGRADVILAGSMILEESMQKLGASTVEVSTQGLRHGLLYQGFTSR